MTDTPTVLPVSKFKLSLQALITIVSFASAFPFIQMVERGGVDASALTALRYGFSALFFLPFCFHRRYLPEKKDLPRILVCALLGTALYSFLLNYGEKNVSASAASLIVSACPIIAAFIGALFLNEKLSAFGWIGSFIALAGVAIVCFSHGAISAEDPYSPLIVLLASCFSGSYTVLQRPIVQRYGAMKTLGYMTVIAGLCSLPFLPTGLMELSHSDLTTRVSLGLLVICPTLIGYGCWAAFCGEIGGAKAGIILYAIPPITIILSIFLEGDLPTLPVLLGGAIALSGMAVTKIRKKA
ncbi:DMT family transporter [Acetobacteraceae bacterium]|nr:DMT family transporter [Acetobacteraceae bacterium]